MIQGNNEEYQEDKELQDIIQRNTKLKKEIQEQHYKERLDNIIGVLGKRIKLSNEEKKELEATIKSELLKTPQLGKDLLEFMQNLSSDNRKVHEKVIDAHKDTINKLFARLDKENVSEKEIDLIYGEIKELSEKIEKARKSWKDWADKVGVGIIAIVGVIVSGYLQSKIGGGNSASEDPDIIEGDYSEVNDERT